MKPLAQEHTVVFECPDDKRYSCYSPGIALLPSGRLITTLEIIGPDVKGIDGAVERARYGSWHLGMIFTSDDRGETWEKRAEFPFLHARPFVCRNRAYVLGHCNDLRITASSDQGETWSETRSLTDGEYWHQAPSNVHYANGCVYLVMEKRRERGVRGWQVANVAPILMRGREDRDLTLLENWTFSSDLVFMDHIQRENLNYVGIPFFDVSRTSTVDVGGGRRASPIGWLETNVVQIVDPDHYWYDPSGKTYHLWARAHTCGTGYAAIAKVVERGTRPGTGEMTTLFEKVPSGQTCVYVPCPGGQMKFHLVYDHRTHSYWLLSTQATDSMTRAERLPEDRFNLPNNERRRLVLHFSRNMIDWCFAGVVAIGPTEKGSRHYASMVINGDDLQILSRSGDERAHTAHDGNLITFHDVRDFRDLIY